MKTESEAEFWLNQRKLLNQFAHIREHILAAYEAGYDDGLLGGSGQAEESAKEEGEQIGYAEGFDAGKAIGLEEGKEEGKEEGEQIGYAEGFDAGKAIGLEEGKEEGYAEGLEDAKEKGRGDVE